MLCSALCEQLMLDYHRAQGSVPRGSWRELAARRLRGYRDLMWVVGPELSGWQYSSSGSVITESLNPRMCCRNPALCPFRTWGEVELLWFLAAAFQQLQHCTCSLCNVSSGAGGASIAWWALPQSLKRKMFFSLRDSWLWHRPSKQFCMSF